MNRFSNWAYYVGTIMVLVVFALLFRSTESLLAEAMLAVLFVVALLATYYRAYREVR